MDEMSRFREDLQLIFPLHLADHEFLVETVSAGEDEELGAAAAEKFGAEVLEPCWPKGVGGG